MTVQIQKLNIRRFRGITGEISIDLRAPITLLYAPNGTGKTTICEAAEWLLTKQVNRLRDGSHFEQEILRSKFSSSENKNALSPEVVGEVIIDNEPSILRRDFAGARIGQTHENAKPIELSDLLKSLVPPSATNDSHHKTLITLCQNWLRGTRFLSSEALAILIDTDENTIGLRKQIFADLLGIRHLLDAEKELDKFTAELSPDLKQYENELGQKKQAAESLEITIKKQRKISSSAAELNEIRKLLDINNPKPGKKPNFSIQLEELAVLFGKFKQQHENVISAEQIVGEEWSNRELLTKHLDQSRKSISASEVKTKSSYEELKSLTQTILAQQQNQKKFGEQLHLISEFKDFLLPKIRGLQILISGNPYTQISETLITFQMFYDNISEINWTQQARRAFRSKVRQVESQYPRINEEQKELDVHKAKLASLKNETHDPKSLALLKETITLSEGNLATLQNKFAQTVEPLKRLNSVGHELLGHIDQTDCPLCGHDWNSKSALENAIRDLVASAPNSLSNIERSIRTAQAQLAEIRKKHDANLKTLREVEVIKGAIEKLENSHKQFMELLEAVNIDPKDKDVKGSFKLAYWRLDVADALALFREEIKTYKSVFGELSSADYVLSKFDDYSKIAVVSNNEILQSKSKLEKEILPLIEKKSLLELAILEQEHSIKNQQKETQALISRLERIRSSWKVLAKDAEINDANYEQIRLKLVLDGHKITTIEQHIAAAKEAQVHEVREIQLLEINKEIKTLQNRFDYLKSKISAAIRAKEKFKDFYSNVSQHRIENLSRVVNPLFGRMHANHIFDSIQLGNKESFLDWSAEAENAHFDPTTDFSQGQRQDFALALFLARARSLGGTFFLDEPISHLDDLNRVGLLDVFRTIAIEHKSSLNLLITTASKALMRHIVEKFNRVSLTTNEGIPLLQVFELLGNGRNGLELKKVYPVSQEAIAA